MAEPNKIQLLLEAERRGILPPDKLPLLEEARKRGLVGPPVSDRIEEPASMTKTAVPVERPPEGFWETLGSEGAEGFKSIADPTYGPFSTLAGVAQIANAPFTAQGRMVGQKLQDVLQPEIGELPASIIATAADVGTQFLGPGAVAKSVQTIAKGVGRILPGSQAARTEIGIDKLKDAVNALMPKSSSVALRAEAMKSAAKDVPMFDTFQDLQKIAASEASGSVVDSQLVGVAERLAKKINEAGNKLSLGEVQREIEDIGRLTNTLRSQGQDVSPGFAQIFKSLVKSIEKVPEGQKLREVATLYRKEAAVDELLNEISKVEMMKRGTGAKDINANRFVKNLEKKDFLRESFEPDELKDVMDLAQKLIEMPAIPPAPSVAAGSGRIFAAPTLGYGIESTLGMPTGTVSGPLAVLSGGSEILRIFLPTKTGRAILRRVLESGPIDQMKINVLAAAARGLTGLNIPPPQLQTTGEASPQ